MLVGSTTKENPDRRRVTVDFIDWLDVGESVSVATPPVVTVDTSGPWYTSPPAVPVVDATPLTVYSTTMVDASTKMVLLLDAGTPGVVYLITALATGSISGRKEVIEVRVSVAVPP
jgi:hypothetical protein